MRVLLGLVCIGVLVFVGCSKKSPPLSDAEIQAARDAEVAAFALRNGAAVAPKLRDEMTIDWQGALSQIKRPIAFRAGIDDISTSDGRYYVHLSDIDNKLAWLLECSATDAQSLRSQRDSVLVEFLVVADVSSIGHRSDGVTEVEGRLVRIARSESRS